MVPVQVAVVVVVVVFEFLGFLFVIGKVNVKVKE
jgi:hypothetical protein